MVEMGLCVVLRLFCGCALNWQLRSPEIPALQPCAARWAHSSLVWLPASLKGKLNEAQVNFYHIPGWKKH